VKFKKLWFSAPLTFLKIFVSFIYIIAIVRVVKAALVES